MTNTKQLPLPRKPPTLTLPYKPCAVCHRPFKVNPVKHYKCCSYACHLEYVKAQERAAAADKEETEMPF